MLTGIWVEFWCSSLPGKQTDTFCQRLSYPNRANLARSLNVDGLDLPEPSQTHHTLFIPPFTTIPTLLQSRIHLAMPARFGFGTDNRRGSAAAIKMPYSQDDCTTKGSHLYPTVTPISKPDAPINADW